METTRYYRSNRRPNRGDMSTPLPSAMQMNFPITVVFILSAPHSGSTWLNLVLGSCSWAYNLGEYARLWRQPGHVMCRLCEAEGLSECTLLHGVEDVESKDCFHFAAMRTGKRIIIDCSKDIPWCESFLDDGRITTRFIHLVRHPAGYLESRSRRASQVDYITLLDEWEASNKEIESFTSVLSTKAALACYDTLSANPAGEFPKLCQLVDKPWEPQALQYWNVTHHGLGGNGAASPYLRGRKVVNYLTGDDQFYEKIAERALDTDLRFRDRIPEDVRRGALDRPYSRALMETLGVDWKP